MIATLAGPSRLVMPPGEPAPTIDWVAAFVTAVAVALLAAGLVVAFQRRSRIDPRERAFTGLCRSLRLPARERALLRKLAGTTPPATLLLSPSAFRGACQRASLPAADLERLARALGRAESGWTA